jgi:hypothetical protein
MKRILTSLLLAIALACGGLVTTSAEPAAADNYDNYSYFYCTKHEGNGWFVIHSAPDFLSSTQVRYWCKQQYGYNVTEQYWVIVNLPLDSNDSWRPWDYQRCNGNEWLCWHR